MSGTSADGVSAVLVKISGNWINTKYKIINHKTKPYSKRLKEEILQLSNPKTSTVDKICTMNYVIGEIFAETAKEIIQETAKEIDEIDYIASHGQTIHHMPKTTTQYKNIKSTLQIGEPSIIAEETGILTIADFRQKDIAAGGEGAPISAYADYIIFRSQKKNRAIQNIGGIANVTYLPKNAGIDQIIAYDTGPGNMIIDGLIRKITDNRRDYDKDGEMAAKGKINKELLNIMINHPYLKRRPPKTTGREEFGEGYVEKIFREAEKRRIKMEDLIATATKFTAKTIIKSYKEYLPNFPDQIILGGGGSYNKTLLKMIKEESRNVEIYTHEDFGIPAQAKEPLIMTILANETIHGHFNNVPNATGAKKKTIKGKIILP